MCGPSGSEKSLAAQSQSLSSLMQADFGQRFGQQSSVLQSLNQSLSPIVAAGPSQQGMSSSELATLNTSAINSAGAAARNARAAAGNFSAGQNNTSGLTSGITKQINAGVDSAAANTLATNQLGITKANYDQGSANYWRALGAQQGVANAYDPSAFGSQAIGANSNAFGQAKTITDQTNAEQAAIAGGISSIAGGFLTGGLSNLGPGESFGEGAGDFLKGGLGGI
jgi:hypothetical protein